MDYKLCDAFSVISRADEKMDEMTDQDLRHIIIICTGVASAAFRTLDKRPKMASLYIGTVAEWRANKSEAQP